MPEDRKRLDALIVDIEDSTTLLKLYVGRLVKSPSRTTFYQPLAAHSREVRDAVSHLDPEISGFEELTRIANLLIVLTEGLAEEPGSVAQRLLTVQEGIDLLEAQLDHMLRMESGSAVEVERSLARLEDSAGIGLEHLGPPGSEATRGDGGSSVEEMFDEDPFDEFALSDDFLDELVDGLDAALDASFAGNPAGSGSTALPDSVVFDHHEGPSAARGQGDPRGTVGSVPQPVGQNAVKGSRAGAAGDPVEERISLTAAEQAHLMELFSQIATGYVGPIVDFVAKLRVGPVTTGWIDLCLPALQSMVRASESMDYRALKETLEEFGAELEETRSNGRIVDGADRARLLALYQRLSDQLPTTFPTVVDDGASEAQSIILNSLLKQIRGVGRVTISRLFSAGLVTLESFYLADPDDLAAAAGIRTNLAAKICDRFRTYREVSELSADADLVLRRLDGLIDDLRTAQFDYKKATLEEWYTHKPSRAKAKARKSRQQVMWKINVAFAELGEVELLNRLKDQIYDKRIDRISEYLSERRGGVRAGES